MIPHDYPTSVFSIDENSINKLDSIIRANELSQQLLIFVLYKRDGTTITDVSVESAKIGLINCRKVIDMIELNYKIKLNAIESAANKTEVDLILWV